MKKNHSIAGWLILLALSTLNYQLSTCFGQGTAFTYQGQLNANGSTATGIYDLRFTIYDAVTNGDLIAGPLTNSATGVTNGLFTVTLDFGPDVFTGPARWLELDVRTNGSGAFTPLLPLQPLLPMPYAIMANTASNLLGTLPAAQLSGSVPVAQLPSAVVTNNQSGVVLNGVTTVSNLSVTAGVTNVVAPLTVPPTVPATAIGSVGTGQWPTSVAVAGRYAYVVNEWASTLQVFDVTTPSAPVSVGSVATGGFPSSVAVAGRYAYLANQGSSTLQILDVSTPSAPVTVGSVATGSGTYSLAVAGRYAYVGHYSPGQGGPTGVGTFQVVDVSNPSAPVSVGSVVTGSAPPFFAVAGRYAYVVSGYASLTASMLQVVDVSNPSAPVSVGSVGTVTQPTSVAVAGRYAYVASGYSGMLQIFDVSNPSAPVNVGSVATGGGSPIAVAGRYAYVVSWGASTLQIFDLGGAYIQQLEAGAMETGTLQTRDTVTVGNNLDVRGGLTVSASARISGGLGVDNGTIAGNGGGLTNLNASSLSGAVPSAALTSVPAASLTGTIPSAQLPAAVVTNGGTGVILSGSFSGNGAGLTNLSASQLFSGTVPSGQLSGVYTNVVDILNPTNAFFGMAFQGGNFSGNGAGLTSLNASQISSGTIPLAQLPGAVLTNNQTGVTLNGTFNGNGGGLTNLNGANLTGTIPASQLGGVVGVANGGTGSDLQNFVDLTSSQNIAGTKNFLGSVGIGTLFPRTALDVNGTVTATNFSGNGAGLTNLNAGNLSGNGTAGFLPVFVGSASVANSAVYSSPFGNIGIGTISPQQTLSVAGTVESTFGGFQFPDGTVQTTAATSGPWTALGSSIYCNAGNVGIGTVFPTTLLDVAGTVTAVSFAGNGGGLTDLNASQLSSGTIPPAQLPGALPGPLQNAVFFGSSTFVMGKWV